MRIELKIHRRVYKFSQINSRLIESINKTNSLFLRKKSLTNLFLNIVIIPPFSQNIIPAVPKFCATEPSIKLILKLSQNHPKIKALSQNTSLS